MSFKWNRRDDVSTGGTSGDLKRIVEIYFSLLAALPALQSFVEENITRVELKNQELQNSLRTEQETSVLSFSQNI